MMCQVHSNGKNTGKKQIGKLKVKKKQNNIRELWMYIPKTPVKCLTSLCI